MIIGLASPIPDLASLPGTSRPGHPVPGGGGGPGTFDIVTELNVAMHTQLNQQLQTEAA